MLTPNFFLNSWSRFVENLPGRNSSAAAEKAKKPHRVEVLEDRIAPSSVVTLSNGSLSVVGDHGGAGESEHLSFSITGKYLRISDVDHVVSASGVGLVVQGEHTVLVPVASLTGGLSVVTGTGDDTLSFTGTFPILKAFHVQANDSASTLEFGAVVRTDDGHGHGGTISLQAGSIENTGFLSSSSLIGGSIDLEAAKFQNSGVIVANGRTGAGGAINLTISEGGLQTASGQILANGGTAGLGGTIALGATATSGPETTFLLGGKLQATGLVGGTITVTAPKIGLESASVEASGVAGGGTILIGGDFQGGGTLAKATLTTVDENTVLRADASTAGHGGKVVIWSEGQTVFSGLVSAKGGANSGAGGLLEVSGKQNLIFRGLGNASAAHGAAGSLLLDPKNIVVISGGAAGTVTTVPFTDTPTGETDLDPTAITSSLNTGTAVTLQANNDITITDAIVADNPSGNGGALTLQAGRSLLINANIETDNGALTLVANDTLAHGVVDADRDAGNAVITMGSGTTLTTGAGALSITLDAGTGLTNNGFGDITLQGISAGATTISSTGGIVFQGTVTISTGMNLTATASGTLSNTGALTASGTGLISFYADQMTLGGSLAAGSAGTIKLAPVTAGRSIDLGGADSGTQLGLTSTELATISAGTIQVGDVNSGTLTVSAAITHANANTLGLRSGTGLDLQLNANLVTAGGALSFGSNVAVGSNALLDTTNAGAVPAGAGILFAGDIALGTGKTLTHNAGATDTAISTVLSGAGSLTKLGAGTLSLTANNFYTGTTTISAGTLQIGAGGTTGNLGGGAVTNNAGLSFNRSDAVTVANTITGTGTLTVTNSGGISFSAGVTQGAIALTNTTGTIAFNGNVTATSFTTANTAYNVALNAGGLITNTVSFLNTGTVTLGNDGSDSLTLTGGVSTSGNATNPALTNLGGAIGSSNAAITFGAATLLATATVDSGSAALNFASTINGAFTLNANSTGATIFGGVVGGTVSLANLLTNTGGTTTLTGNVSTTGGQSYGEAVTLAADAVVSSSASGVITFNGTVNGAKALTVNTANTTTFGAAVGNTVALTSLTTDAAGSTIVTGNVTTSGTQSYGDNLTLAGAVTLKTTNANLSLAGTVTGATNNLSFDTGTGTVGVTGAVSGVGTLTVTSAGGTTFSSTVSAATVALATTAGNVTFNGALTATTGLTVGAGAFNVALNGGGTIAGSTTFSNTGTLTVAGTTAFTGGVTATAPSTDTLSGTITAAGIGVLNFGAAAVTIPSAGLTLGGTSMGAITLGAATLADGATLTVGTGIANAITLSSVSGTAGGTASNLTLNTYGAVSVTGAVGTDIGTVTVAYSGGTTFGSTVDAATVALMSTVSANTITFTGALTVGTALTTGSTAFNVALNGGGTIAGATTFSNTGTLTIAGTTAFTGGVAAIAPSSKMLSGTITAAGTGLLNFGTTPVSVPSAGLNLGGTSTGMITLGAATLADGVTLSVGTGIANAIRLSSVTGTTGGTASNLTFNTTGAVSVTGAVGTDIGTVTVTNSGGTGFGNTVDAATVALTASTAATTIAFNGALTVGTALTTGSTAFNVALNAGGTIAGSTTFSNTGTLTVFGTTAFTGGVTATAPSTVALSSTITAAGTGVLNFGAAAVTIASSGLTLGGTSTGAITLGAATLADSATLTVGTGIANAITLSSVSGTAGSTASNLTLNTTGSVSVTGAVGTDIGTVTVTNSGGATFGSTVSAARVALTSTTGTITFTGALTATTALTTAAAGYNVALNGGGTIAGATTFSNTGTLTVAGTTAFTGGATATAPSSKTLSGTVTAAGTGVLNFGTTAVSVPATGLTLGGTSTGAITLGATTLADGATLTVGTGIANAITLSSVTGTAGGTASNLTLNTTGAVSVTGAVGTDIGTVTVTNSGGTTFGSTVSAATVALTSTTGTITFTGALTATTALTTAAASYNVAINGGGTIAGATTFSNTGTVTVAGTTAFTGGVTATAPSTDTLSGTITAAGTGVLNFGAAAVTIPSAGLTLGGTSTGAITLGAATLADSATLTVGTGIANAITLSSITGTAGGTASNLTLNTTGAVSVIGAVGTDIGTVTVTNSGGTTFSSTVNAATVALTSTTGTITFTGALTANTALTTAAASYNVALNGGGTIAGATTFSNTGTLTVAGTTAFTGGGTATAPSSKTLSGTITAAGTGVLNFGTSATTVAGNLTLGGTSTGAITLGNTTLAGGVTLTVGAGANSPVTVGTVTGTTGGSTETLILNSGTAALTAGALYGSGTASDATGLTAVTVTNAGTTNFNGAIAITGALTQTNAATGATTFGGAIAVGSAVLKGTSYAVNSSFTTASGGALAVTNSGTFTLSSAGAIVAPGGFSASGAVSLANNITTTNTTLSLGGTLDLANAANVTLSTQGAAGVGDLTITGAINGNSGATAETLTLAAGSGTLTLSTLSGAGGVASATGLTDVTVTSAGTTNFNGAIAITGALTQTNAATGTTTFGAAASVGSAVLKGAAFAFNAAFTSVGTISLANSGAVIGTGLLTGTTLTLSGAGAVGASGARINAALGTLILNKASGATYLNEASALDVQGTTGGLLDLVTSGAITQGAALSVTSTATFSAGANSITLNTFVNDFSSTVALSNTGANNVALSDTNGLQLGNVSVGSGTLTISAVGLTQAAATSLTQAGAGAVSLSGGAGVITLANAGNDFVGAVSLSNSGANAVSITDTNALAFGTSSVGQNLLVSAGGSITQTGALTVPGTTSITLGAAASDILLADAANNFTGALSLASGAANLRDLALRNTNSGATVPTLSGATSLRNLALTFDAAGVALPALSASGTLAVVAGGNITQTGTVSVTGNTTLTAGANNITLTDSGNAFATVSIVSGATVALRDDGGFTLGASAISTLLSVQSSGAITQSGAISGLGGLTKLGSGTLTLSLNNAYSGTTTVGTGTVALVSTASNNNLASSTILDVQAGATLDVTGLDSTFTDTLVLGGAQTLKGNGSITGNLRGTGTVAPGNSPGTLTFSGDFIPTGTVAFDVVSPYTTAGTHYDQIIVGGAVDLSGASLTFTGGGVAPSPQQLLKLISKTSAGATVAGTSPAQAGTVTIGGTAFKIFYNGGDGNDVVLVDASTPTVTYVEDTAWSSLTPGTIITDADLGTAGNQSAIYGVNAFSTIASGISGVTTSGQIIVNDGTYAEAVSLNGTKTLTFTTGSTVTTNSLASISGSTLQFNGTAFTTGDATSTTIAGTSTGGSTFTKQGGGTLTFSGNAGYTGATTISGGTLALQGDYASPSYAIGSGAVLELNVASGTRDYTPNTNFSGAGTLSKTGGGTARWGSSAGTFALGTGGLIDVQAGTLVGGAMVNEVWSSNLASLNVASGATFQGAEANVRVNALTGGGTITSGATGNGYTGFTFGVDNGGGTFSGTLSNSDVSNLGNFVKTGSGTQILTGTNDYTGTTTINGGTLQIGNGGTTGTLGSGDVTNTATLVFNRSNALTVANNLAGAGALTVTNSAGITFSGTVAQTTVTLTNTTGTIGFSGNLTAATLVTANAGYNVSLTGTTTSITNDVNFLNTGTVTLGNGGDSLTFAGGLATAGNASNPSGTTLGGTISTTNQQIDLGAVTLGAASTVSSGTAALNFAGTVNGAFALTANSTGITAFAAIVGGTAPLASLTTNAGGSTSLNGNVSTTGAQTYSDNVTIAAATTLATSGSAVSLAGTTTLNAALAVGTSGGSITFTGAVDGAQTLGLTAGAGNILFSAAVGGTTRLGAVTIASANDVTESLGLRAASLVQSAGTGTTTLTGAVDTNAATGVALTTSAITVSAGINTTNNGVVTFTNAGLLSIAAAGDITADGAVTQNGAGAVSTAGDITTTNDNITFGSAVTLTGAVALNSGAGAGNILFSSTVNGGQSLGLTAGTGNITFSGAVGGSTRLGAVTVTSATSVMESAGLTAASFVQSAGTGTTTLTGAVDTNTATGVALTTSAITVSAGLNTTNNGVVTFTNAGLLSIAAAGDITADGAVTQNGAGAASTAGDITTTNDNITFGSTVTLTGAVALNSGAGAGNIVFSSTVNGGQALGLTAGTGNVTFSGAVGGTTRLGAVTVTSAADVTESAGLTAASLVQSAGTGTTTLTGAVDTNTATGVALTTSAITVSAGLHTTNNGVVTFTNAGLLSIAAAGDLTADGAVTQNGAGAVSTAGDITTTNDNISFLRGLTLTGAVALDSGAGAGDITFSSTVTGAQTLGLTAGTGNITFTGAVGATALTSLTINSAADVTTSSTLNVGTLTQSAGSGTTTFGGAVTVTTASLTGTAFTLNANFTSTGTTTVTNSGAVSGTGVLGATTLTLNGGGAVGSSGSRLNTNLGTVVLNKTAGDTYLNETNAIALQGTTAGNFDLTAAGDITQAAALSVTGTSRFSAGANLITLNNANNDFTGAVTLLNSGAKNVALTDKNAISIAASTVGTGTLAIDAIGITQTGAITQGAAAGAVTLTGHAGAITLNSANDFTGPLTATSTSSISVNDATGTLTLASVNAGTTASFTTTGGNLLITGNVTSTGNTTLTSSAAITQSGGTTTAALLTASAVTGVVLNTSVTTLDVTNSTSGNIAVTEANGLSVTQARNSGTGNVSITTTAGDLATTGLVSTTGVGTVTLTAANALSLGGDVTTGSGVITLNAGNGMAIGAANVTTSGNVSLDADSDNDNTGAITSTSGEVTGSLLTVKAAQGATLNTSVATLTATNSTSGDITITEANGLALNLVSNLGRNVSITVNAGALTDNNGAASNVNAATLTIAASTGIDLDTQIDTLTSATTSTGNIDLNDLSTGLAVNEASTGSGSVTIATTGGVLALNGDISGTTGILLTGTGLTQAAATTVDGATGTVRLDANDGAVTLQGALSSLNSGAAAIEIYDAGAVTLGNLTAANGTVVLGRTGSDNIAGAVTQFGTTILNIASLQTNTAAAITLTNDNFIDVLAGVIAGGDISVRDVDGDLGVGAVTSTGNTVTLVATAGAIVDTNAAATNIVASVLNLSAVAGIGVDATGGALETTINTLKATTVTGGIGLSNSGALTVADTGAFDNLGYGARVTGVGAISLTSGALVIANDIDTDKAVTLTSSGTITETGGRVLHSSLLTTSSVGGQTLLSVNTVQGFNATNTVGGQVQLENTASTLTVSKIANNTGTGTGVNGFITVHNTGALDVTGPVTSGGTKGGDITLRSSGVLTVTSSGSVNSLGSSGGTLTLADSVVFDGVLTVGYGNVTLQGAAGNLSITAPISVASSLVLSATGDVNILAPVSTTSALADLGILADSDGDGIGGVYIGDDSGSSYLGKLSAGRDLTVRGSAYDGSFEPTLGGGDAAIIIESGTEARLEALNNVLIKANPGLLVDGQILLGGLVQSRTSGAITFDSAVTLISDDATVISHSSGNVIFNQKLDGAHDLTLSTDLGVVLFNGAVGSTEALGNVQVVSAQNVFEQAGFRAETLSINAAGGTVNFVGAVTLSGPAAALGVTAKNLNVTNTVTATNATGDVSLKVDNLAISGAGSFTGTGGLLSITTVTTGRTIGIGGAGDLNLSAAEALTIDGFARVTIGTATGTGLVTIGTTLFHDAVSVLASTTAGTISQAGALSVDEAGAGVSYAANTINLGVAASPAISTLGGPISLVGGVQLLANTAITAGTAGGSFVQTGSINGGFALSINTGTGQVDFNGREVANPVGASIGESPLASLTVTGGTINVKPTVRTSGDQNWTGSAIHLLNGPLQAGGSIAFHGPVTIYSNGLSAGGDITFDGTLDAAAAGSAPTFAANGTINLGTLAGSAFAPQAVGSIRPLTNLTISRAAKVNAGDITVLGNLSIAADEIDFFGGADSISGGGTLTLLPYSANQAMTVGGSTDTAALDLQTTDLEAIGGAWSSVVLGKNGTAGLTFIGTSNFTSSLTLNGPIALNGTLNTSGVKFAGAVTVTGDSTVTSSTAGGNIAFASTLIGAGSKSLSLSSTDGDITFATTVGGTGNLGLLTATVSSSHQIILPGALTTVGGQTYNGAVKLPSNTTLKSAAGGITFNDTIESTGGARSLTLTAGGDIAFQGAVGKIGTISTFTVTTTGGDILSAAELHATGVTTLSAVGHSVTVSNAANSFGSLRLTAFNATVVEGADLDLSTSVITGNLSLTSAGAITDSGTATVSGRATITTTSNTAAIILDATQKFMGPIKFVAGGANSILVNNAVPTILAGMSLSGNLEVRSSGAISQENGSAAGALIVGGTSKFTATSATNISLANAANNFGTLAFGAAKDVDVKDVDDLVLGTASVSGAFSVAVGEDLTQSGILSIAKTSTFRSEAGTINLPLANRFTGALSFSMGTTNSVNINNASSTVLGSSTLQGDLTVTTPGNITQTGALTVAGATVLHGLDITLKPLPAATQNSFGSLALTGRTVTLSAISLILNPSTVTGALNLNTTNGDITSDGGVTVAGLTTLSAPGHDITLGDVSDVTILPNSFGTLKLTAINAAIAENAAVDLGVSTLTGNLQVASAGAITDSGVLTVGGLSNFSTISTTAGITLDSANKFTGAVTYEVASAAANTLVNSRATALGAMNLSGAIDVRSVGPISQTGPLVIGGLAKFTATTATTNVGNITLNNPANDFATVNIVTGVAVDLRDANALVLGTSSVTGTLTVRTGGDLTQSGLLSVVSASSFNSAGGIDLSLNNRLAGAVTLAATGGDAIVLKNQYGVILAAGSFTGDLTVTSGGAITQTGALTFAAGTTASFTGTDFTLSNPGNSFKMLKLAGRSANVASTGDFELAASTLSGAFTLAVTGGDVTSTGTLKVGSTTTLSAPSHSITLDDAANTFGTLKLSGLNVTIVEAAATDLGTSTVTNLDLTSTGAITDSAVVNITHLNARGTSIVLDLANNFDQVGTLTATAGAILINDNYSGLVIAGPVSATGSISLLTAGGNLGLHGAVTSTAGNVVLAIKAANTEVFANTGGSISAAGRFFIYAGSNTGSNLSGLAINFREAPKRYPSGPLASHPGNVFFYWTV